jgi:hypothetical protein
VEPYHDRPADLPNACKPFMMIDALAPANSVSAAHLANSPIGMGRPSPPICTVFRLFDRHRVVYDGGIKPGSEHVVNML